MICALFASCSSDNDDNDNNNRHEISIDDKLIKSIELYDVTGGDTRAVSVTDLKYDNERRVAKVKVEETEYNDGKTSAIIETLFTYENRKVSFSTMTEEGYSVWLSKGFFDLDKHGRVSRAEVTDDDNPTVYYTYKYDGSRHLTTTSSKTKGCTTETQMEWSSGNIVLFEWKKKDSDNREELQEFERVEYTNYYNNASLDLARLICFGGEGSEGPASMSGTKEGNLLGIVDHRVQNMPSVMTELVDGYKEVKNFEYKRDRNNRIYEINVRKVRTYRNEQSETKEYKYLIGY